MPFFNRFFIILTLSPFMFGRLTSSDISIFPFLLSLIILAIIPPKISFSIYILYLIGLTGLALSFLIVDNFSIKSIFQYSFPFVYLSSLYPLLRTPYKILSESILVSRCILILYAITCLVPSVGIFLSNLFLVNRPSFENGLRSYNSILSEPSFAAFAIIGFLIIFSLGRTYSSYKSFFSYRHFYFDIFLSLFCIVLNRSVTGIILLLPFLPSVIHYIYSRIRKFKIPFSFLVILTFVLISLAFLLPTGADYFSSARIVSFTSTIASINLFDALLLDISFSQRFLNLSIFASNYPLSSYFFFGSSYSGYATYSLNYILNSSINFLPLISDLHPWYTAQVSALPVVYFNYGFLPATALFLFLISSIKPLFVISKLSANLIVPLCYFILCLFCGPSLLFPIGYFVLFLHFSLHSASKSLA